MEDKRDKEKQAVLEKILKDKENGFRVLPTPGYRDKMQIIRSNKVMA